MLRQRGRGRRCYWDKPSQTKARFLAANKFAEQNFKVPNNGRGVTFLAGMNTEPTELDSQPVSQNWQIWMGNNIPWILFFNSFPLISLSMFHSHPLIIKYFTTTDTGGHSDSSIYLICPENIIFWTSFPHCMPTLALNLTLGSLRILRLHFPLPT